MINHKGLKNNKSVVFIGIKLYISYNMYMSYFLGGEITESINKSKYVLHNCNIYFMANECGRAHGRRLVMTI